MGTLQIWVTQEHEICFLDNTWSLCLLKKEVILKWTRFYNIGLRSDRIEQEWIGQDKPGQARLDWDRFGQNWTDLGSIGQYIPDRHG